jgi:uroporphyrinogen decarboxylase
MSKVERVLTSINLKRPDRIPMDIGGPVSGISKIAYDQMAEKLGLPPAEIADRVQQLARLDERFLEHFDVDTRHLTLRIPRPITEMPDGSFRDSLGYLRRKIGHFYEMTEFPLESVSSTSDVEAFPWPFPKESEDQAILDSLARQAKIWYERDYAVILDPFVGGIFEESVWLRGGGKFYVDLRRGTGIAQAVMDKILEIQQQWWEWFLDSELADLSHIVLLGDDYGMETRPLFSPTMFSEIIQPRLKRLCDSIKKQSSKKIILHSCGSIFPLIDGIIAAGVDVLNPIQPTPSMAPEKLKKTYGDRICFHGGLDTQHILPHGSNEEICNEVGRLMKVLGHNGGYIFATAHNVLPDVTVERMEAMLACAMDQGKQATRQRMADVQSNN